ncbi:hypothetical protein MXL46_08185 [Heyndrickxia sporothermodurans]|uniref:hypothetical protein n=1 Tax=Heyndrickxia sporothermodurans TaxID=46224 RepID=UPI002DB994A3|nr:hypothetical protein [Heyndrickxia sporothermodurans]MEB6549073.1 hypothetical protein [Heyndrickxia sporothermodurans]
MKMRACSICGIEKPETREYFYFRNDSQSFRRDCKECNDNVKTRKNKRKPGVKWDYQKTKELFLDNNLTPLFEEFEGIVPAKEKLTALNDQGYKVCICIDKLRVGKIPNSFSKFNPYTIENIKLYLQDHAKGYELLSTNYPNNYSKLKWKCDSNHIFEMNWADFNSGRRCAKCSGVYKRTNEEFLKEVFDLVGNEYTFLEAFKGVDEKIKVVHNKCNHEYEVTPYKFINVGRRCPSCNESKGEKRVRDFLASKGIRYKEEYTFDDCKLQLPLRFDFAVFDKLDKLISLIEYDGKQHFKPFQYYGGVEYYKMNKIRDSIKNDYCKKKNIKLIRIPYTEYDNIEKILAAHL